MFSKLPGSLEPEATLDGDQEVVKYLWVFLAFIVGRGNLGSLLAFWGLSNIFTYYSTAAGILSYSVNEW